MPVPIILKAGDRWTKNGETRTIESIGGSNRHRRVWYRCGNALIDCRHDNFKKWCKNAAMNNQEGTP